VEETKWNGYNSEIWNSGYGIINIIWSLGFCSLQNRCSYGKENSAKSVDDNELLYFTDVFHFEMEYYDGAKTSYHYCNLHMVTDGVYILKSWNVFELIIT
jgi:hypothetical protein